MAMQKAIQISTIVKNSDSKALAAQLAGKKTPSKPKTWTQTFAASGGKLGGKANTAAE